jgi:sterol carrier protein 2
VAKVKGIYQFEIAEDDRVSIWTVDLKNGDGSVMNHASEEAPGCTITMKAADFQDMVTGKLKGQMAFMTGKLKISGNMGMALKLESIFKAKAKL